MKINVRLERKPDTLKPPVCQVEKVVEMPANLFDEFLSRPFQDQMLIEENKDLMGMDGDVRYCLLILGQDCADGVLVESEGASYARYAAFVPSARIIVNAAVEQAADLIAREGAEHTSDGSWRVLFSDLYKQTGLVVRQDNGIGAMLMEKLPHRPEIAEVRMTGNCFDTVFHPEYCKNLTASTELSERPARSQEQLVNKLLDYLAEHDGSAELYQMLHGDLGMSHEEIESLGFELSHRYEEEPNLSGPKM